MNTTVFLDFDGVLHPSQCDVDELFCRVPLLESVLRIHPHVRIVISSSWRAFHTLDELRSFFSEDIAERIEGMTPVMSGCRRQRECVAWMRTHDPRGKWIALDDNPSEFSAKCRQLILTNAQTGLGAPEMEELRRRLPLKTKSFRDGR